MPNLFIQPIHLGLGASALVQPEFTGMEWYAAYEERHADDGIEGRLVSMYVFTEDWSAWEMHPEGAEVVLCVAGAMTIHQELAAAARQKLRSAPATMPSTRPARGTRQTCRRARRRCS